MPGRVGNWIYLIIYSSKWPPDGLIMLILQERLLLGSGSNSFQISSLGRTSLIFRTPNLRPPLFFLLPSPFPLCFKNLIIQVFLRIFSRESNHYGGFRKRANHQVQGIIRLRAPKERLKQALCLECSLCRQTQGSRERFEERSCQRQSQNPLGYVMSLYRG